MNKICQSCGMPIDEKHVSKFSKKYCIYCQDQEVGDLKTREEVREGSIQAAVKFLGKSREEAEKMADRRMKKLPRWKNEKS